MKQYNSLQEVYDTAVAGLASQGFQHSYNESGICAYRDVDADANGRKCAIGHCIPDEVYSPEMELKSIATLLSGTFENLRAMFPTHISKETLRELQLCHDMPDSPRGMRVALWDFARKYKLRMPESIRLS